MGKRDGKGQKKPRQGSWRDFGVKLKTLANE
jgi:hypothetical protein